MIYHICTYNCQDSKQIFSHTFLCQLIIYTHTCIYFHFIFFYCYKHFHLIYIYICKFYAILYVLNGSLSYIVFKTNPVVSILSTFVTNFSYSVFFTASFFITLLSLAKSSGTGVNFAMYNLSRLVFKLARFAFYEKLLKLHVSHSLNSFYCITTQI